MSPTHKDLDFAGKFEAYTDRNPATPRNDTPRDTPESAKCQCGHPKTDHDGYGGECRRTIYALCDCSGYCAPSSPVESPASATPRRTCVRCRGAIPNHGERVVPNLCTCAEFTFDARSVPDRPDLEGMLAIGLDGSPPDSGAVLAVRYALYLEQELAKRGHDLEKAWANTDPVNLENLRLREELAELKKPVTDEKWNEAVREYNRAIRAEQRWRDGLEAGICDGTLQQGQLRAARSNLDLLWNRMRAENAEKARLWDTIEPHIDLEIVDDATYLDWRQPVEQRGFFSDVESFVRALSDTKEG